MYLTLFCALKFRRKQSRKTKCNKFVWRAKIETITTTAMNLNWISHSISTQFSCFNVKTFDGNFYKNFSPSEKRAEEKKEWTNKMNEKTNNMSMSPGFNVTGNTAARLVIVVVYWSFCLNIMFINKWPKCY